MVPGGCIQGRHSLERGEAVFRAGLIDSLDDFLFQVISGRWDRFPAATALVGRQGDRLAGPVYMGECPGWAMRGSQRCRLTPEWQDRKDQEQRELEVEFMHFFS
jgi:hypothetical protein